MEAQKSWLALVLGEYSYVPPSVSIVDSFAGIAIETIVDSSGEVIGGCHHYDPLTYFNTRA